MCVITTNHCLRDDRPGGRQPGSRRAVPHRRDLLPFDREGPDGEDVSAEELTRATAASLHDEFATVVSTRDLVG